MPLGFELNGATEFAEMLGRVQRLPTPEETAKPRKLFGEYMQVRKQEYFAAGTAPDGTPWPASARAMGFGGQTMWNRGKLLASINYELDGADFLWFSDDISAAVHNEGKTIVPKPGHRALAIPLSKAVADSYQAGVSIREQYPDSWVLASEGGNAFIVRRSGEGNGKSYLSSLEFLFLLVPSVTMPKRTIVDFATRDVEKMGQLLVNQLVTLEGNP